MTDHERPSSGAGILQELTTQIVTAYVSNHTVPENILPKLISTVFQALKNLEQATTKIPDLVPAVPIKESVFPDYIICLEDGKKLKLLKRHLQSAYGMTPQQYRKKWNLPESYPMVAPSYSIRRSALAQESRFGKTRKTAQEAVKLTENQVLVTHIPEKKRGRRPKQV